MALETSPSPFAVLRRRNFALMWTAQLVSTVGNALTSLAASIWVYRVTEGSAMSVGLMLMATAAPSLLVGLLAGVFVDRYDRRRIMIISDLLRALLVCLIPFLVPHTIAWLYIIVMLSSAIGQFFDPAYESLVPQIAPDEELAAANSLIAISQFGSTAIGFAASGLIAANYPIEYAFYLDSLSFLLSAACVAFLRLPTRAPQELGQPAVTTISVVVDNLKTGLTYLLNNPILRSILIIAVPIAISFGLQNSLLLPFASRALGANEAQYGLQEGLTSVGFVIGSLLMAGLANRWREGLWIVVGLLGIGLISVVYSQLERVPIAILFQMISGFLNAPYIIARRLLIQRNTINEMRGRVASAFYVTSNTCFLVGMAAAGLADVVDVRVLYLASGIVIIGCGLLAQSLPGLGQPAAEWRRALALLRSASAAGTGPGAGPGIGRPVQPVDVDLLIGLLPALGGLTRAERGKIITQGRIIEAPPGARLLQAGDAGDCAYFILSGRAVAGIASKPDRSDYHSLSIMTAGDYFGEIAALTGAARTADVVAEEPTTLLEVPAPVLRILMAAPPPAPTVPAFSQVVLARMSERLARTSIRDLPRFAGLDQQDVRELREEASTGLGLEAA